MFFWTKFDQKGEFQSETKTSEYHHWILDIWINLGTRFQLKLLNLIFWAKCAQKWYFRSETEISHLCGRPWSLLTILNFSARDRQTQRYFNISSSSSRRDNKITDVWTKSFIKYTENEWLLLSPNVTAKISVGFCLDTGKRFVFEVSFQSQEKEHGFF